MGALGGQKTAEETLFKPKLYVLAVGVSKYKNPDYNLGYAAKDASDFTMVFQKQKGKLYSEVVVQLLTGVTQNDIKVTLNSLAGKAIFFVDSCHSGNALDTSKTRALGNTTDALVNELASAENGVVVFSSSTGKQLLQENPAWGNGAFTKTVVEGLSGKADYSKDKSGKITHKGLDLYVTERVKELTKGQQSPVSISPSGVTDFPIAIVR